MHRGWYIIRSRNTNFDFHSRDVQNHAYWRQEGTSWPKSSGPLSDRIIRRARSTYGVWMPLPVHNKRYSFVDKRHVLNRIRRKDDINKDSNTGLKLDTGDPRGGDVWCWRSLFFCSSWCAVLNRYCCWYTLEKRSFLACGLVKQGKDASTAPQVVHWVFDYGSWNTLWVLKYIYEFFEFGILWV